MKQISCSNNLRGSIDIKGIEANEQELYDMIETLMARVAVLELKESARDV